MSGMSVGLEASFSGKTGMEPQLIYEGSPDQCPRVVIS